MALHYKPLVALEALPGLHVAAYSTKLTKDVTPDHGRCCRQCDHA